MDSLHLKDKHPIVQEENKNDNKKKNLEVTPIIISPKNQKIQ